MARSPLNDQEMAAWRAFLRAQATVLGALERELESERGLPIAFYDVLAVLSEADDGRLRMSELAKRVVLSRSGVTRLVDRMERQGLVQREQCPADRRGYETVITAAGRKVLEDAWPVHARGVAQHFAQHLSGEEARVLAEALGRMAPTGGDECPWSPADLREERAAQGAAST
jgi:DNA-binding MarR family transcriptional regulator